MRIALTGTHGVGKTTLLKLFEIPKITEVAREIIAELGNPKDMNDEQKKQFQRIMFGRQIQRERRLKHFIADRSLFDILAYTRAIGDDALYEEFKVRAIEHYKTYPYDVVFYIPIEFELELDGVRYEGEDFRKLIDSYILDALKDLGITPVELRGNVSGRELIIRNYMKAYDKH